MKFAQIMLCLALAMLTQSPVLCGVEIQPIPRPIPEIAARNADQRARESQGIRHSICADLTNGPDAIVTEGIVSLLGPYLMDPDSDMKAKDLMVIISQRFFSGDRFQSSDDMRLMGDLFMHTQGWIAVMIQKRALSKAEAISIICGSSNFVKLMESHRDDNYTPIKTSRPVRPQIGPEGGHSGMAPALIHDPVKREEYMKVIAERERAIFENARQRFIDRSLRQALELLRTTLRCLYPAGDAANEARFTALCEVVGIKPDR